MKAVIPFYCFSCPYEQPQIAVLNDIKKVHLFPPVTFGRTRVSRNVKGNL